MKARKIRLMALGLAAITIMNTAAISVHAEEEDTAIEAMAAESVFYDAPADTGYAEAAPAEPQVAEAPEYVAAEEPQAVEAPEYAAAEEPQVVEAAEEPAAEPQAVEAAEVQAAEAEEAQVVEAVEEPAAEAAEIQADGEAEEATDVQADGETEETTEAENDGDSEATEAESDGESEEATEAESDGESEEATEAENDGENGEATETETDGEAEEKTDEKKENDEQKAAADQQDDKDLQDLVNKVTEFKNNTKNDAKNEDDDDPVLGMSCTTGFLDIPTNTGPGFDGGRDIIQDELEKTREIYEQVRAKEPTEEDKLVPKKSFVDPIVQTSNPFNRTDGIISTEDLINGAYTLGTKLVPESETMLTVVKEVLLRTMGMMKGDQGEDPMTMKLKDMQTQMAQNSKALREMIGDTSSLQSYKTDMESFDNSMSILLRQIESIKNDKNMSEDEKLVRIAAKLGPSTQWSEDGKFINKISKLGRILKGDNYIDKRDLYNVVYDINKKTSMFSGEALDKSQEFVDRALNEYYMGTSLALYCLDAQRKVAGFSKKQIKSLSDQAQDMRKGLYLDKKEIDTEIKARFRDVLGDPNASDPREKSSILQHYADFMNKDRLVFINRDTCEKKLADTLKENTFGQLIDTYNKDGSGKYQEKLRTSALSFDETKALAAHVCNNYKDATLTNYLVKMGFDKKCFEGNTALACSDAYGFGITEHPNDNDDEEYFCFKGFYANKENPKEERCRIHYFKRGTYYILFYGKATRRVLDGKQLIFVNR